MNKSEQAKALGVSRPTLYKMIKVMGENSVNAQAEEKQRTNYVFEILREFNFISPYDIENFLEYLEDKKMLTDVGKKFRDDVWDIFIKEQPKHLC
jgi:hypothetical protein